MSNNFSLLIGFLTIDDEEVYSLHLYKKVTFEGGLKKWLMR